MVGYNVQSAVDTRHHLIVAHEVTNVGSDRGQLSDMTEQARAAIGSETIEAIADRGYYSGEEIVACEQTGVTVYLPKPITSGINAKGLRQAGLRLCRGRRRLSLSRGRAANLSLHQ